jgi:hypothetical protein
LVIPAQAATRCWKRPAKAERTLRNTTIQSTVTTIAKGRPLGSIKYGGHSGDSVVSFELFDEGGKTRLRLTHVGLQAFAPETNPDSAPGNSLRAGRP